MPDVARTRYLQIASRLARAIADGTFAAGDRLPSVRSLCRDEKVSPSTAVQALARLESLGAIEARPRSGFFVRPRLLAPAPRPARPAPGPKAVTVSALVQQVYRAARDPRLVPLGASAPSPALLPTAALARAMGSAARRPGTAGTQYEMPPGLLELRRVVARRLLAQGCAVGPEELVVTSGATEAILVSLLAVTSPGDSVAIESPAFFGTLQAIEALGLRVVEVPSLPDAGLDVDALERTLERERVAAVVAVPNFSNPLGGLMPDAAKARLVRLLSARGLPLVEDDVYGDLAFDGTRPRPARAWDRDGLVVLCGSFSKSLAPGYRIGFVATGRHHDAIERLKFATNVASATLPQRAIASFLASGGYDRHLRSLRARLEENVARTSAAVAASFPVDTRISRPRGGCNLWIELPPTVDALQLHARALDAGVAIAPGQIFSPTRSHGSCVRLNCGEPWSPGIAAAVSTVGALARTMDKAEGQRRRRPSG